MFEETEMFVCNKNECIDSYLYKHKMKDGNKREILKR